MLSSLAVHCFRTTLPQLSATAITARLTHTQVKSHTFAMSSDLTFGAMTPDPNTNNDNSQSIIGPVERKLSKGSIRGSELDQSIPSPPLSPYLQTTNDTPRQFPEFKGLGLKREGKKLADLSLTNGSANQNTLQFQLTDFEKFPLVVNAWNNVGEKNYKRSQLSFLRQYATRAKTGKEGSKVSAQRKFLPRSTNKPTNYFIETAYNSDSDYSSNLEKVRTRRVVKEAVQTLDSDVSKASSPSPIKRKRPAASSSPAVQINVDWESVPDFSPSHDTLPNNNRCMKVEWKGQPMDLKQDPLVHLLHPAEIMLASILRLPVNLYLDSKRRLFQEKVARMRKGLPFRRTDAQKSCRIDVNKASRLFAAFEKCGWLEDDLFEKYMS